MSTGGVLHVDGGNTEVSGAFPEQVLTVQCHLSDIPRLLREPIKTKEISYLALFHMSLPKRTQRTIGHFSR
jgi:hypothetical protein